MYRLIIVEDDENIRTGLAQLIDWRDLGFEVMRSFADGAEALSFLNQNEADVLLTDIRMQTLDGIALTRALREQNAPLRVVFISGYRDFAYAKAAVDQDVEAYLLKPIKLDELYAVFSRIKQALDAQQTKQPRLSEEQRSYLASRVLYELLLSRFSSLQELREKQAAIGLNQALAPGFLLLLRPMHADLSPQAQQVLWEATEEPLLRIPELASVSVCVLPHEGLQTLLIWSDSIPAVIACHGFCRDELAAVLQRWIGQEYYLCTGDLVDNPMHFAAEYRQLHRRIQSLAFKPQGGTPEHRDAERIIDAAKAYITGAFAQPLTLQEVAAHVRLSPAYFSRLFKATLGESYVQYLTRIRMEAAMRLLSERNAVIWRVAEAVGYPSQKYFSRIFKAVVGQTPSEYQDRQEM